MSRAMGEAITKQENSAKVDPGQFALEVRVRGKPDVCIRGSPAGWSTRSEWEKSGFGRSKFENATLKTRSLLRSAKQQLLNPAPLGAVYPCSCWLPCVRSSWTQTEERDSLNRVFRTSFIGGRPNIRLYSRLNWLALSYPTENAAVAASTPSSSMRSLAACNRSFF